MIRTRTREKEEGEGLEEGGGNNLSIVIAY